MGSLECGFDPRDRHIIFFSLFIGYSWSGVRPSSSSVVNNLKHLLLQNRLPDQSQILCGATLGRGNESLFAASESLDLFYGKVKFGNLGFSIGKGENSVVVFFSEIIVPI